MKRVSQSGQDKVRGEYQKTKNLLPAKKQKNLPQQRLNGFCSLMKLGKRKNI